MRRPAFQFYPADWRKDSALQSCSTAAKGLWIEMMCIAHECSPYGVLSINGKAMTAPQIARLAGETEKVAAKLIAELEGAGVLSRTEQGAIYSRRMVKDEQVREARAKGGEAGAEHGAKGAEHGAKGGRPPKENPPSETSEGGLKGGYSPENKPPPSTSSSSSSSKHSVANATGGKPPADPADIIFSYGTNLLVNAGSTEKNARSFLGKLRMHYGDEDIVNTLRECLKAKPLQPLEWLAAALPPPAMKNKTGMTKVGQQAAAAAQAWLEAQ